MSKKRVGVFFLEPILDSVPSICNMITLLARDGCLVDVFVFSSPEYPLPIFDEPTVTVRVLKLDVALRQRLSPASSGNPIPSSSGSTQQSTASRLRAALVAFTKSSLNLLTLLTILRLHFQAPFQYFIGVEPAGLVRVDLHSRILGVPLIYYSLELLLSSELSDVERPLKQREQKSSQRAWRILIQDADRAKLLAEDNNLPLERFVMIPNAPLGPAQFARQRYWHEKFGLPPETKILLYAGGIWLGTGIDEIVSSAAQLPDGWVLVVHTRSSSETSTQIQQLRASATPGKVLFSLTPVTRKEYDDLVSSADIGIAFYVPIPGFSTLQSNLSTLGLSSGKVAYYLRAGLPVIVNNATSIADFVRDFEIGATVESGADIAGAVERIMQRYDILSQSAREVFASQLDFENSFRDFLKEMRELGRHC
ncbi:MAG: hypothetical protein L6Q98_23380 [Anaerolineae bacterium]|nr:hypothetical protein [Anaerolineae bacterium]NUQ06277.1 hypothetical protein [Anaerolineae bacterium]